MISLGETSVRIIKEINVDTRTDSYHALLSAITSDGEYNFSLAKAAIRHSLFEYRLSAEASGLLLLNLPSCYSEEQASHEAKLAQKNVTKVLDELQRLRWMTATLEEAKGG